MSEPRSQIVFKELFERYQRVQIPMIQRDYAQGRESEKEVRDEFLDALHAALVLPADDESLPLNLDFIYGSVENDGVTRFLPLDGQQRLTTLFLLHWYLSWRDGELEEFRQMFCSEGFSCFYYSVRPSGTEFFDALVGFEPNLEPDEVVSLSALLVDQSWYFRYWRLDPTIQSSLTMLDAIHLRFKGSAGLFSRVTSVEQPAITFQLLNLEDFGLSDDLYIKMNSRGKPLTAFETFKARFEQELEDLYGEETRTFGEQELPVSKFFSHRMDTRWADFFWPYRDLDTNVFDEAIMNLFRTAIIITRSPENDSFVSAVVLLRNKINKSSYSLFYRHGWLDREFSEMLILLLETWSGGSGGFKCKLPDTRYLDEVDIFSRIVTDPTSLGSEEFVQLAGYAYFLRENEKNLDPEEFQEWMRIVFNLSVNTDYNRPADLQRSFSGLLSLAPNTREILEHFAKSEKPVAGFNSEQISEEKLKAQLLLERADWRLLFERAERHGYFRGQIEFLLDFSGIPEAFGSGLFVDWSDEKHSSLQNKFLNFLQKAEAMFSPRGLNDLGACRWERALLSVGDYLLQRNRNRSFLVNLRTDPSSWKRLLKGSWSSVREKRELLRDLWERLNGTEKIQEQLDEIIDKAEDLEPWRKAFVRTPSAIDYCSRRFIRWNSENEIYLLKTTQMNGTYAELFTYCFYEDTLRRFNADGALIPLKLLPYQSVVGMDIEPGVSLKFPYGNKSLRFEIEYSDGQFLIYVDCNEVIEVPQVKMTLLEDLYFREERGLYSILVGPELIESTVLMLAEKLTHIPSPEQDRV